MLDRSFKFEFKLLALGFDVNTHYSNNPTLHDPTCYLEDEHGIAITKKSVLSANGFLIGLHQKVFPCEC